MGKKRSREVDAQGDTPMEEPIVEKRDASSDSDDDESSDEDMNIVNVDFELFNYDPEIDFHGVKTLLRQLFDADAQLFDLSGLSDMIITQNTIGSTCKVDGKENDAYAFITVLNMQEHRSKKPIAQLIEYLSERAKTNQDLAGTVPELLASGKHVGLVLSERLINMPAEVIPPMWRFMIEEIEAAVEDKEPYEFTHYLVVSRTYHEVESTLDQTVRKKKKGRAEAELQYFHPEDEEMRKHALASGTYSYIKENEFVSDSKRAFQEAGIKPCGFMMLIEANKIQRAVQAITEFVGTAT